MSLYISLQHNPLTQRPNDFMAIVRDVIYKDTGQIIKQMTGPGSILKETECLAVINSYWGAINENLKEGMGYSCEYLHVTPAAGGVFTSDDESFDESKHWKDVNLSAGTEMRDASQEMKVSVIRAIPAVPYLKSFFDIRTEGNNQGITPGFMADITGDLLKIQGDDSGVFFINTTTNEVTQAPRIHVNEPKKLSILVPETMPKGSYKLEVRTHVHNVKDLRTGTLNAILSVA
jgi:hypothetical protein